MYTIYFIRHFFDICRLSTFSLNSRHSTFGYTRLKGTDWKLAFGGSVGIIEKILACVQPELHTGYSYTRNTYNNVFVTGLIQGVHKLENFACFFVPGMPCIWPPALASFRHDVRKRLHAQLWKYVIVGRNWKLRATCFLRVILKQISFCLSIDSGCPESINYI